jgi:hypothetical protein
MLKRLIKFRSVLLVFLTHKIALPILKIIRRADEFPYSKEELVNFPAGSLGHDLFLFLERRKLRLLKHYARHDLKHIVLGFDTTDEGEACLQCFMLGNGRISFPVVATVLYSLLTMPEYRSKMKNTFYRGRNCPPVHHWPWYSLLHEPTSGLRKKIFSHY